MYKVASWKSIQGRAVKPSARMRVSYAVSFAQALVYLLSTVGLNATFPLWLGVILPAGSDSYFVWFVISGFNAVFWGTLVLAGLLLGKLTWSKLKLPHWKVFLAGFWYAQNGLLVFASDPERTPMRLQPVMEVGLPFTILIRAGLLKRFPDGRQKIACAIVVAGIVICLLPTVCGWKGKTTDTDIPMGGSAVFWSLFLLSTTFGDSVTTVYAEGILEQPGVSMFYYLYWMELWHFVFVVLLFWFDMLPFLGYAHGWDDFVTKFRTGFDVSVSGGQPTLLGILFLGFWALQTFFRCVLIRFGDGATWSALMDALSTPATVLLLSIVEVSEIGVSFKISVTTEAALNLFGACLVVPGLLLYDRASRELLRARGDSEIPERDLEQICSKDELGQMLDSSATASFGQCRRQSLECNQIGNAIVNQSEEREYGGLLLRGTTWGSTACLQTSEVECDDNS